MEIEQTSIYKDIRKIIDSGYTTANLGWTVRLYYGNRYYDCMIVNSVNLIRNYAENISDVLTVTVQLPLGFYSRQIWPMRSVLEASLKRVPLLERSDDRDDTRKVKEKKYTAILLNSQGSPTVGQGAEGNDQNALDLAQLVDVNLQLIDKPMMQLRTQLAGTVMRSTNVEDALRTLLTLHIQSLKVDENEKLLGVDISKTDNKDVKGHIVLPAGMKTIDVPDYVQARYGVYNAGLGTYVQGRFWYVYPLYDTSDYESRTFKLVIYILPKRKYLGIERTFLRIGNIPHILITNETNFTDDNGKYYMNFGNGMRFADANLIMNNDSVTSGNKTLLSRDKLNSEFRTDEVIGNVNNVPLSAARITANPFAQYSIQAAKNGGTLKLTWDNSDPDLIIPGICAKIIYEDDNKLKEVYGIVQTCNSISHKQFGFGNDKYKNMSILEIFINSQKTRILT